MEMDRAVLVANAPVSYGAFERTIGLPGVPTGEDVLSAVAGAGYDGIDLGPVGFLGRGGQLRAALATRGLALAGGYVELPFSDPASLRGALARAGRRPRPVRCRRVAPGIPSASADARPRAHARARRAPRSGRAATDRSPWTRRPGRRSSPGSPRRSTGAAHAGTSRRSIRSSGPPSRPPTRSRPCSTATEIGLCLDTGHFLAAGGDPVAAATRWAGRINQVHVKDARLDRIAEVVRLDEPADAVWSRGVFCPIGEGDLDVAGVLDALRRRRLPRLDRRRAGFAAGRCGDVRDRCPGAARASADPRAIRFLDPPSLTPARMRDPTRGNPRPAPTPGRRRRPARRRNMGRGATGVEPRRRPAAGRRRLPRVGGRRRGDRRARRGARLPDRLQRRWPQRGPDRLDRAHPAPQDRADDGDRDRRRGAPRAGRGRASCRSPSPTRPRSTASRISPGRHRMSACSATRSAAASAG